MIHRERARPLTHRLSPLLGPALSVFLLSALAGAQTHYKLVRTDVVTHIAGKQPVTSVQQGGVKTLEIVTNEAGFLSRGNLNVGLPDKIDSDKETFTVRARLETTWTLKNTTTNINSGLSIMGVPKSEGRGDPGPWLNPGSQTMNLELSVETSMGPNGFVRKWVENGKNYRSFELAGHTGVVQTLSGFKLTYVYEETADERPGKVEILEVVGDVSVSPGGDDSKSKALKPGDGINEWDRIVTGMDSKAKLRFPDGTIVDVGELSDMKVACYIDAAAAVQTRLWLRGGEVTASVNKSGERPSSFEVKTPTSVCGTRGTRFTLRHNKLTGMTTVQVAEGKVEIVPINPSLKPFLLEAGKSVDISLDRVSAVRS